MANHGHPTLSNIIIYIEFEVYLIPQILQIRKCFSRQFHKSLLYL